MHLPVAASFNGSFPAETTLPARLPGEVSLWMGTLSMVCAAITFGIAHRTMNQPNWVPVLELCCAALLVPALMGFWFCHVAKADSELSIRQAYSWALEEMNDDGRKAVSSLPAVGGVELFGRLLGQVMAKLGNLQRRRDTELQANIDLHQAFEGGRLGAIGVSHRICNDHAMLSDAAARVDETGALAQEKSAAVAASAEILDNAAERAIESTYLLAESVRGATASLEKMTLGAINASEVAHATHRTVADIEERTAKFTIFMEQFGQVTQALTPLAKLAIAQATRTAPPAAARLADGLQELTTTALTMLDGGIALVAELASDIAQARRRMMQIGDMVHANNELAQTMSEQLMRQGEQIAKILNGMYEGRSGFVTIRESVEAVTRAGLATREAADLVRQANSRLPDHARQLDNLFRNVPPRIR